MSRLFFRHGLVMALTAGLGLTFQALPAQAAPADAAAPAPAAAQSAPAAAKDASAANAQAAASRAEISQDVKPKARTVMVGGAFASVLASILGPFLRRWFLSMRA